MKNEALYLHFVLHGLEKTVVDSQLIEPALRLKQEGISVSLLVMEDIPIWLGLIRPSARHERERRVRGLKLRTLPRIPRNIFYLNTALVFLAVLWPLIRGKRIVVHARGLQGAATWVPLRNDFQRSIRLLCDVRGIEWDEYGYTKSRGGKKRLNFFQRWWVRRLEKIANRALGRADVVSCVSRAMREALIEQTKPAREDRWIYMPCSTAVGTFDSAREKRQETRSAKGWTRRAVVVYSGAFREWQMPEASVDCVLALKKIEPKVFFYCITPDVSRFKNLIEEKGLSKEDYLVEHRPFAEMPDALAAGDVGLLLREDSPLNRYACPTKFAEYLAAGLCVITTKAIEDLAEIIQNDHVGAVVSLDNQTAMARQLTSDFKALPEESVRIHRSVEVAKRNFNWDTYIPMLKKWYLELGHES